MAEAAAEPSTSQPLPRISKLEIAWRHSIFAKLFFTMMTMAAVIMAMMTLFSLLLRRTDDRARRRSSRGGEHGAFGRNGSRSKDPTKDRKQARSRRPLRRPRWRVGHGSNLPSFAEANRFNERWAKFHVLGRQSYVFSGPEGRKYLFSWRFYRSVHAAHNRLVLAILASIALVVLVAHAVLRASIRPVQWLREGFAELRTGNLMVSVPKRSGDEFGVLTEEFNHMVEGVREMVTARDRLLLDVSHELRSPLTRMKVALALSDDDEHKAHLLRNVAEMEEMVSELLELERLRNGRGLNFESCNLVKVLEASVARFEHMGPRVRLMERPEATIVDADPEKLRTVFDNVLDNAIKYSLDDSRPIEVSASVGPESFEIRIEDDGQGIPDADLHRVFEPFFRVDRSRSRKTGGFGLGLSLCERIVHAHRGRIELRNLRPRGTTCVITLPLTR
ncbi:MAG: HAMP domain-containing sensor histidine kinase [Polyangiaceae bacterium]